MKCFDSSSIVGDDIVSVKLFESGSGELSRESEKWIFFGLFDKFVKLDKIEEWVKESFDEISRLNGNVVERKLDYYEILVFDEVKSFRLSDIR